MTSIVTRLRGDHAEKKAWKAMEVRADALPRDYRVLYGDLTSYLWKFTAGDGKDIIDVLDRLLALFETGAAQGKKAREVTGTDLAAFVDPYVPERPAYQAAWRDSLNRATEG